MIATGYVRKVDRLGRLVVPNRIRSDLHLAKEDPVEIYVEADSIVLTKYEPKCVFCGEKAEKVFHERAVCGTCLEELKTRSKR
ncbi:AbrB/MazE/SpoVT family DNA-binding domain-containing protein [Alicyclobacillus acidocaldarius]|uniref:Transcriptional regulator, AbrB family n=1 Tax=Alicyclobacillus acidocaldarius subsp. acidocaldarius (strain ATCC 27009 / DSM 446 / BCRC 14685 / JCM 5260 / KCTC 1825 / NBRC 15652 / NCIMB 11725 / NRRL B-14509 / 104-IA) TaxID=521098 RepID=C8WVW3_ALIAD|nr:AbrB/MazE/SpoVT family DNA-binding domain-containing protein [Alicyclobacillus acidocaldarius]ACV58235.1 transcriptional regulator, AbrB family [Alicyclobacillus acidocaldarius subsp. acidocaldarius DSM 446]